MSFELHNGFDKRSEYINEVEFQDIARSLKALAVEQGFPEDFAIDQFVRLGPVAAAAALGKPART